MARLRRVQTQNRELNQVQANLAELIEAPLSSPLLNGNILGNQALLTGDNTIVHKLGRTLQGWAIVRQRAAASIYDKQATNATPDKTLILHTSAPVTVDLLVF